MIDLCEILINTHFQFKGEKWEISHEVAWRLQESRNDSYCFSMDTNLLFRHKTKLSWFDVIFCEVKKKKNPQNSSVYFASLMDQLFLYSPFPMNMFTMVYCDTYLTSFASSYLAPQLV